MGKFVVRKIDTGFVFTLKSPNGQVIATSQVYTTEAACIGGIESIVANAPIAPIEDQTVAAPVEEKNPKFEMFLDKVGEFRFRLKATNGQIIAASEGYTQKVNCLGGIESVKKNAPDAEIVKE